MKNVKRNGNSFRSVDDNSRVQPRKNVKVKTKGMYKQKRVLSNSLAYLHLKYNTEGTRKYIFGNILQNETERYRCYKIDKQE